MTCRRCGGAIETIQTPTGAITNHRDIGQMYVTGYHSVVAPIRFNPKAFLGPDGTYLTEGAVRWTPMLTSVGGDRLTSALAEEKREGAAWFSLIPEADDFDESARFVGMDLEAYVVADEPPGCSRVEDRPTMEESV